MTATLNIAELVEGVSIHTALAGGDLPLQLKRTGNVVSIHTALAGGDMMEVPPWFYLRLFQSTPPSRAVTGKRRPHSQRPAFQSTPPLRAVTSAAGQGAHAKRFQSTPPLRAVSHFIFPLITFDDSFNPHRPCGR